MLLNVSYDSPNAQRTKFPVLFYFLSWLIIGGTGWGITELLWHVCSLTSTLRFVRRENA